MSAIREIAAVSSMGLRSIPRRLGSSLVIVTGIAGVVLVLLSFLAMAGGLSRTLASSGRNDRAIVLRRGADSEGASSLTREATQTIEAAAGIRRTAAGKPIASPEVLAIAGLPKKSDGSSAEVTVRGVTPMGFTLRPELALTAGRMVRPGLRELVVGRGAQSEFRGLELGQRVPIRDTQWTVVGVYKSGGDARESELVADAESLLSVQQSSVFHSVTVQLEGGESFDAFKDALTTNPALTVSVVREQEYYARQSRRLSVVLSFVAYLVGGIMAIGAMFGALSTMYSAVSTRTVEIGTLRAIGFGAAAVVASVLIEALLLAAAGAMGGAGLAWLAFSGRNITTLLGNGQIVAQLQVSGGLFALAIVWACAIGLAGGLFPAVRAARMPVAEALRSS